MIRMTKVLVVEDNADLAFGLQATLAFEGYDVEVAATGEEGVERVETWKPDLILLDIMLPGEDGLLVLARLRRQGVRTPVLLLTAKAGDRDVLEGFSVGADDYLRKPFSTLELVARIRAILRRAGTRPSDPGANATRIGNIEIKPQTRVVLRSGLAVALTPKEFDLLLALASRGGAVATRSELLREVWGYASTDVQTRTVDIHVAELRRKLEEDPSHPEHLITVRKVGYRMQS